MGENYGYGGYWNPAPPRNDPTMMYGGVSYSGYYQQRPDLVADWAPYLYGAEPPMPAAPAAPAMPAAPATPAAPAKPTTPAAPSKPTTPAAPSKPATPAAPAKPAVPAAAKTKAPKKTDTPKAPAASKPPATKPPAVTKPDPPKTPAQPATPKAPEQPAVPAVTQPKVSAVPCRTCQQQARQYNMRLNSGTPGCKECEYLAAFLSYHKEYPTTEIPNQQVLKYQSRPRSQNFGQNPVFYDLGPPPAQGSGRHPQVDKGNDDEDDEDDDEEVVNKASKKKSSKSKSKKTAPKKGKKESKRGGCFCCSKKPNDDDDEEEEEEEEKEDEKEEKPEPQQPLPPNPCGFMPLSPFQERISNPHIFRGAILAGYTPYPTRHPHPIDKSYMWGQYAPFGMDGRAVFAPSMR